ncbi:MAG TPA: hypothetical protein VMD49_10005 [Steroidobacteraceae bacterium]|nr:hypothetical protein [Steroidobacteraceae bacterium]
MYAAHFAAGLAVKGRVERAPLWALLTAAFLPDLLWIAFARAGIEPEYPPRGFFDDWSHSALMILIWSTLFALPFWKRDRTVAVAVWIAGMSHLVLDFLIHPARIALYPHASVHLGWSLWRYGQQRSGLGPSHYWWLEAAFTVALLALYALPGKRSSYSPRIVAASCLLVFGLHLLSV